MPLQQVNGIDLYYEDHGAGEPILFHHGYTGSHHIWRGVIERLSGRYRCIAMDARGAGDSSRPEDGYNIAQYAADVVGLVDSLGIERFTYVGHSMGGGIGMWLGLEHASRLDRLILVAGIPSGGIQIREGYRERQRRLWQDKDRETLTREAIINTARPPSHEEALADVERSLSVSPGHYEDSWAAMRDFRVTDRLKEVQTPTLIVAGAADNLVYGNVTDAQRLPNATLHVFSRVSHTVPAQVPGALSRVIDDFMQHGVVTAATLAAGLTDPGARR